MSESGRIYPYIVRSMDITLYNQWIFARTFVANTLLPMGRYARRLLYIASLALLYSILPYRSRFGDRKSVTDEHQHMRNVLTVTDD